MKAIKAVLTIFIAGVIFADTAFIFITPAYSQGQSNYEDNAISQGYQFCFKNSGVAHRLGILTSKKLFQPFLETLQPGMVRSGEPKTFAWVDGAARFHMCTCIVELEPTNNWVVRTSEEGHAEQKARAEDGKDGFQQASINNRSYGKPAAQTAEANFPCGIWWPFHALSKLFGRLASRQERRGARQHRDMQRGNRRQESRVRPANNPNDIIKFRDDIVHSRTVSVMNFQFHMGSPIKSMWGDIDEMTFYPPVQACAVASFNYNGQGNIHRRGGSGSDPKHECGLIAAF